MAHNQSRSELAPHFSISKIVTGLWQIADMERDGKALDPVSTARAMSPYADAGLTTFDMADHYGSAEIIAGQFRSSLADSKSAQLLTKWVPDLTHRTRDDVRAAIQQALIRLQAESIDLLQYHAWSYSDPIWLDHLLWLQELKEEGLIRHLGVTNFDAAHLNMAVCSGIEIVTNQICYSLLDQRASGEMTAVCQKRGVQILAFGTLAGGFLSERWVGKPPPSADALTTWSQKKYYRFIEAAGGWDRFQVMLAAIARVANRYHLSIANIATRYILEQPATAAIIIGARLGESEHISDNLRLLSITLDDDTRREIAEALSALEPIPGDCGDEYRKSPFLTATGDLSDHLSEIPPPYSPVVDESGAVRVFSGVPWESMAGYCRAIKRGTRIHVSGTTASHRGRTVGGNDAVAQAHFAIDKIEGTLLSLGSGLGDVIRTRIFVRHMEDWEAVAKVHGARFAEILPANTLVSAELVGEELLVEIEAEAEIQGSL